MMNDENLTMTMECDNGDAIIRKQWRWCDRKMKSYWLIDWLDRVLRRIDNISAM